MKYETKLKIIGVVKKLLRWNETIHQSPIIEVKRFDIRIAQSRQMYLDKDLMILSLDQLKYHANLQLMSELDANGIIKYETIGGVTTGHKTFIATLKVIVP